MENKVPVKQQGLSSDDLAKRGGSIPVDSGKTMAISSDQFKGGASTQLSQRFDPPIQTAPVKKRDDPLQKEKEMLANSIFGVVAPSQGTSSTQNTGLFSTNKPLNPWGASSTTGGVKQTFPTGGVSTVTNPPAQNIPVKSQQQRPAAVSNTIDLLDMDFSEPNPQVNQPAIQLAQSQAIGGASSSQKVDLLGALSGGASSNVKPATNTNLVGGNLLGSTTSGSGVSGANNTLFNSSAAGKNQNLLSALGNTNGAGSANPNNNNNNSNNSLGGAGLAQKSNPNDLLNFGKPAVRQINYQPYKVSLEEYEQFWESYPAETIQILQNTSVRNEAEFNNLIKRCNLAIVEVIGNEVICSGKNSSNEIVLVYAIYESSGKLELRIKCRNAAEKEDLYQKLRQFAF